MSFRYFVPPLLLIPLSKLSATNVLNHSQGLRQFPTFVTIWVIFLYAGTGDSHLSVEIAAPVQIVKISHWSLKHYLESYSCSVSSIQKWSVAFVSNGTQYYAECQYMSAQLAVISKKIVIIHWVLKNTISPQNKNNGKWYSQWKRLKINKCHAKFKPDIS